MSSKKHNRGHPKNDDSDGKQIKRFRRGYDDQQDDDRNLFHKMRQLTRGHISSEDLDELLED
jgi:hypothetical protein